MRLLLRLPLVKVKKQKRKNLVKKSTSKKKGGDLLMVRRLLGGQSCDLTQSQRENIFHTRCKIFYNTCFLIVDSGSCCNCCSTRLVSKSSLAITSHPKPYKLQWLNEQGEMIINQQVKVPFSIGTYKDEVIYDVVPMEAGHLLLGRPWKYDRKIIYNGLNNEISLTTLEQSLCCILKHLHRRPKIN